MDTFISKADRTRINPATEDKQDTVKTAVDAVATAVAANETDVEALLGGASLIKQSTAGGQEKLTIAANVAVGTAQACRSALINVPSSNSGNIHLSIDGGAAVVTDWLCPQDTPIPVPVDDVSDLKFYGGTNDDVVYILWRN